jgi:hypothetical protein
VLSAVGAVLVFVFGVGVTITSGGAGVPIAVLCFGVVFLASVLFDYPVSSRFTTEGVQRRAMLRRHTIDWDRVAQLTRSRPALSGLRNLTPGGMAAKVGRRRYLLVDQCEALSEFEALVELLEHRYVELGVDEMVIPPVDVDPTWTYRRKHWQPDR